MPVLRMPVMRAPLRFLLPAIVLLAVVPATTARAADKPSAKTLYADGPEGRYLIDGNWLFRLDNEDQGVKQHYMRQSSSEGWKTVQVPNVWNLGDPSNQSMAGGIGWYRKDFELPNASKALAWAVRFESVNYRSRVWLNGRPIGENTGAYIPFSMQLPGLKRKGTNRLVIRVDSRRLPTDFPPSGLNADGVPTGGWWNYGGIQREVYLQRMDTVAVAGVQVRPVLSCAGCAAKVKAKVTLRALKASPRVSV